MADKTRGQKTVPVHLCEPGDVLAKDVHNPSGQKVVSKDKELTSKLIKRLSGAGVRRITVYSDEIEERAPRKEKEKKTPEHEVQETEEGLLVSGDLSEEFSGEGNVTLEGDLLQGASIEAEGDVRVEGEVTGGKIESRGGKISVNGPLKGEDIELIADKLVDVESVEEAEVSVEGNLLVHGEVSKAEIDCIGDMIVHQKEGKAQLADSEIRVEGKLFADEVENSASSSTTRLVFEDPEKKALKKEKRQLIDRVEELEQEYAKLEKMVETVRQLGEKVKNLSEEKKKKLKKHTRRFKNIKSELSKSEQSMEKIEEKLEELKNERRYFMKVLNTLRKDTEITMDNTMIKVDEDEWDVKLYKKSMIVMQNAEDDSDRVSDWLQGNH